MPNNIFKYYPQFQPNDDPQHVKMHLTYALNPLENLMVDVANHVGLDKESFAVRLMWVKKHFHELETFIDHPECDHPIQYAAAVMSLRRQLRGIADGHLCSFDASASGIQINSCLTLDFIAAKNTGLTDTLEPKDVYTHTVKEMNHTLSRNKQPILFIPVNAFVKEMCPNKVMVASSHVDSSVTRKQVKTAGMCYNYGSYQEPKKAFAERPELLELFFDAFYAVGPKVNGLRNHMIKLWCKEAEWHIYTMADNFEVRVASVVKEEWRIEGQVTHCDNINARTLTKVLAPQDPRPALAAHLAHGFDGMVVREMGRRCNYTQEEAMIMADTLQIIDDLLVARRATQRLSHRQWEYNQFLATNNAMTLTRNQLDALTSPHLHLIKQRLENILSYPSFELLTIHDDFRCHANHVNRLRYWYKEILAEIAEALELFNVLHDLNPHKNHAAHLDVCTRDRHDFAKAVRNGAYAIT